MKKIIFIFLILSNSVVYAGVSNEVKNLQTQWAEIKYNTPEKEREKKFEQLLVEAEKLVIKHPDDVNTLIWEGIIRSTYAGENVWLGALGEVKKAKASFEHALEMNPAALNGSAYTSLGSLYYQVPGWPIGFGNSDKAEEMLKKGLETNPDGLDSNYFYGDFLKSEKKYTEALLIFEKALNAPPRPNRELADQGRKKEVELAILEIKSLLEQKNSTHNPF
jgi:tetratricopeptide (TPR) repeat protein